MGPDSRPSLGTELGSERWYHHLHQMVSAEKLGRKMAGRKSLVTHVCASLRHSQLHHIWSCSAAPSNPTICRSQGERNPDFSAAHQVFAQIQRGFPDHQTLGGLLATSCHTVRAHVTSNISLLTYLGCCVVVYCLSSFTLHHSVISSMIRGILCVLSSAVCPWWCLWALNKHFLNSTQTVVEGQLQPLSPLLGWTSLQTQT